VLEGVHPGLDISHRHRAQRLDHEGKKTPSVGGVGALSVRAAAVQPEIDQLRVAVDLGDGCQHIGRKRPVSNRNYVEQISRNRSQTNVRVEVLSYIPDGSRGDGTSG
jgi:hypothetical protein